MTRRSHLISDSMDIIAVSAFVVLFCLALFYILHYMWNWFWYKERNSSLVIWIASRCTRDTLTILWHSWHIHPARVPTFV